MFGILISTVICLTICFFTYYFFIYVKQKTDSELFMDITLTEGESAVALTIDYVDDTYVVLMLDENGNVVRTYSDEPIGVDGKPLRIWEHGTISNITTEGYDVSGFEKRVTCPERFLFKDGQCVPLTPCDGVIGDKFVGLDYYQSRMYHANYPSAEDSVSYHQRLYVQCPGNKLLSCEQNYIFKGVKEIDIKEKPCIHYDICAIHFDGFRHIIPIDDKPLQNNQFYFCTGGKSVKITCDENLVVNRSKIICENAICDKGSVRINPDDPKNSYFQCVEDGVEELITCPFGTTSSHLECISDQCAKNYPQYRTEMSSFGYNVTKLTCSDNFVTITTLPATPFKYTFQYVTFSINDYYTQYYTKDGTINFVPVEFLEEVYIQYKYKEPSPENGDRRIIPFVKQLHGVKKPLAVLTKSNPVDTTIFGPCDGLGFVQDVDILFSYRSSDNFFKLFDPTDPQLAKTLITFTRTDISKTYSYILYLQVTDVSEYSYQIMKPISVTLSGTKLTILSSIVDTLDNNTSKQVQLSVDLSSQSKKTAIPMHLLNIHYYNHATSNNSDLIGLCTLLPTRKPTFGTLSIFEYFEIENVDVTTIQGNPIDKETLRDMNNIQHSHFMKIPPRDPPST